MADLDLSAEALAKADLDALERLARAATAGPWFSYDFSNSYQGPPVPEHVVSDSASSVPTLARMGAFFSPGQQRDNAAFIAAANPLTVLALVAELRRLREEVQTQRNRNDALWLSQRRQGDDMR